MRRPIQRSGRRQSRRLLFALTVAAATACGPLSEEPTLPTPSQDAYAQIVHPVLEARCGNPSTCHAREDRPFAMYARRANRLDPADVFRDPPLTEEEMEANYDRVRSFTLDMGAGPLLLTKPLDERFSRVSHEGGVQFDSPDDREYRVIEEWIR